LRYNKKNTCFLLAMLLTSCIFAQDDNKPVPEHQPPVKGFWESVGDFFLPHLPKRKVIYEKESEFFNINVQDDETGKRHLVFLPNKGSQGVIIPSDPDKIVPNFMKYSFLSFPLFGKGPEKILFIGLGAGIMPRFISSKYPDCRIDIVEIDKAVPDIAEKFFGFKKNKNVNVIIEDGRFYVNRSQKKYDIIVIDAYNASSIPFQFTTVEFFQKVKNMLNKDGVMVANIANFGKENFTASEFKTIKKVFENMAVVVCPNESNFVVFSSPKELFDKKQWKKKCLEFDLEKKWHFKLTDFLENRILDEKINKMTEKAEVLTDDFAPVNHLD
jgi:protein-L-isoaspartate O-methyltransferase